MAQRKKFKELSIDSFGALVTTGIGVATKDPTYLLITAGLAPIFGDMAKRMISPIEKSRIDQAESLAVRQILGHIEKGTPVRKEFQTLEGIANMRRVLEGSVHAARNSYAEKKVPLIANLIATAPFTNTPLENLINTLQLAESLSYRQLSILSLYAFAEFGMNVKNINFASGPVRNYGHILDETFIGMRDDILMQPNEHNVLMPVGLRADIVPANIIPKYNGTLLVNGLILQTIPDEDIEVIAYYLDEENLKAHGQDPTKPNPFLNM